MVKNVLLVYDGTDPSIKALSYAYALLDRDSKLTILYVLDLDRYESMVTSAEATGEGEDLVNKTLAEMEVKVKKQLSEYLKMCSQMGVGTRCVLTIGKIAETIIGETRKIKYDLLILPIGRSYEEKMGYIMDKIITSYKGNILVVK